jgi:Flp pilus assembly protein TadG
MKTTARMSKARRQSGQSLVEVALLTPLLLAILLGATELGRYAYISILVGNAAHAGALYGAQSLGQSATPQGATVNPGIKLAADNDFQNNGQNIGKLTVSSNNTCGCDSDGSFVAESCNPTGTPTCASPGHWVIMVSVNATGTFQSLFKYPWIPRTLTISRTSTMRVAQR